MNNRKHSALLGLSMVMVMAASPAAADLGAFTIQRFHTDLTIQPNSDLMVEERLVVNFTSPRHGIYRIIPIRYTDRAGFGFSLGFRLLEVVDEAGRAYKAKVSNKGRYIKIRIGDPGLKVNGQVTYLIRYRVQDAVSNFPEHDELYWNATGNEWNTTIRKASATVRIPGPLTSDSLEVAGYFGAFGTRGMVSNITYPKPGTVSFETDGPLDPMEGLTVDVIWPKGYVSFPGIATRIGRFLADNWVLGIPPVILVWLWRRYQRRGRDPMAPAAVVVRYDPPEGVTPGELGTLIDETVDLQDITASVVDLAVRGYLVIRVEKKEVLFGLISKDAISFERKRDKLDTELLKHERLILNGIFETGDVVSADDLKEEFYTHIPSIHDALYEHLTTKGYFAGNPKSVRQKYQIMGVLVALATGGVGIWWAVQRGSVLPLGLVAPIIAAFATLCIFLFLAPAMPRRTRSGAKVRSWALGFQEFVDRVEKNRLAAEEAKNVFEALLPFAMALGISTKWAKKFEGIYEDGSSDWYVGHHMGHSLSTRSFEQSLSSSMSSVGKNLAASPRSSGSAGGGGGFSGGGGGGGGGGSW